MPEWAKILISALAGMTTAIIVDPIRQWISIKIVARRARKNLYQEMGRVYCWFNKVGRHKVPGFNKMVFSEFKSDVFEYYYGSHRESFYQIPEAWAILAVYTSLRKIQESVKNKGLDPDRGALVALEAFDDHIRVGALKRDLIGRYEAEYEKRVLPYTASEDER